MNITKPLAAGLATATLITGMGVASAATALAEPPAAVAASDSSDIARLKQTLQNKKDAIGAQLADWHKQVDKQALDQAFTQADQALTSSDAATVSAAIDALDQLDIRDVTSIADALSKLTTQQQRYSQYSDQLKSDITRVSQYSDTTATSLEDDTAKAEEITRIVEAMKTEELQNARTQLQHAISQAQAKLDDWKTTFTSGREELKQAVDAGNQTLKHSTNPDELRNATQTIKSVTVTTQPTTNPVSEALAQLNKELTKGFTYSDELTQRINQATTLNADSATSLNEAQTIAQQILDTLTAIQGNGLERLAYNKTLKQAQAINPAHYTHANALTKALANQPDLDSATAPMLSLATNELNRAIDELRPASWSIDGVDLTSTGNMWSATLDHTPTSLEAVASDGTKVVLTQQVTQEFQQSDRTLGVGTRESVLTGSWRDQQFNIHVSAPVGEETTGQVNGHNLNTFTSQNGVWVAQGSTELGDGTDLSAVPETTVTLSDGTVLSNPQVGDLETVTKDGATIFSRTLTFTGADSHGTPVKVEATASATFNDQLTVTLHQTGADGTTRDTKVVDGNVSELNGDITLDKLPFAAAADQFSLSTNTGANVHDVHVAQGVLHDGTRVFTLSYTADKLEGAKIIPESHTLRVTVPFDAPKREVGNMDAALETITLNGQPIEGFNDNQVDYTVHVGADEKVKLSPKPRDGQTVVAGDISQTAYTVKQSWTVTKGNQRRVYTVTVVRDHETPTADEAFTPNAFDGRVSNLDNTDPANTLLASVGFTQGDMYAPQNKDTFTIPEGGTFGYESYKGQVVTESSVKVSPMTYKITLGVLSADRDHWQAHEYTVTYLTKATHKAELTGINVDGVAIPDFNADKTEYTVGVDNPERYTVVPQFDKMSGMSVSTHKDGRTVTITVTSADGLETRTYMLHVMSKPVAKLAQTGSSVLLAVALAGVAALAGVGMVMWRKRKH